MRRALFRRGILDGRGGAFTDLDREINDAVETLEGLGESLLLMISTIGATMFVLVLAVVIGVGYLNAGACIDKNGVETEAILYSCMRGGGGRHHQEEQKSRCKFPEHDC